MHTINDKYLFAPKFSFYPNKVALFNEVSIRAKNTNKFHHPSYFKKNDVSVNSPDADKKKVVKKFHNFKISDNAFRNLKNKINWLYHLSKSRYVKTINGREIYNFKMLFLTLTLPSKQIHPTAFITKNCLNQFLVEMKKIYKLENFVWRLEFQKNGNLHYHLVTDTFIDYHKALYIWNRILNKYGYIDRYSKKFLKMSLGQYFNYITKQAVSYGIKLENNDYYSFKNVAKRYALQRKKKFKEPHSIDVKSVTNNKKIANYISKYFGKNDNDKNVCNSLDNESNSFSLRLWYCSRSLSKLKSICHYIEEINWSPSNLLIGIKGVKIIVHQYCTVIYYDFSILPAKIKGLFYKMFRNYSYKLGYRPATFV